jgi:hypothetical protein
VKSLLVVDALQPVIEWHQRGLVPLGKQLTGDPRTRLIEADFFARAASTEGFDPTSRGVCFTPCCWISIIRRAISCIRATRRSTNPRGLSALSHTSIPAASSPLVR